MSTPAENELLTETGPGTPGGRLLRSYWQPAALTEELEGDRPVIPVRLLGEDLVVFKELKEADGSLATYGVLARACAHRRADLSFGRLEDGGLRCPFHGWLFDRQGTCLETPAEPEGSTFCTRVSQVAYPTVERNGIIWTWMGEGDAPPLPGLDAFAAPSSHVFSFKGLWDCNWLQAHEVGIDPAHASFLHRFLGSVEEEYGLQFRATVADTGVPTTVLMRDVPNPTITAEPTSYGFRLVALRPYGSGSTAGASTDSFTHVRVTNCIFPNAITIPMSADIAITQWHVPIDDESCYWYSTFVSYTDPVDADVMRAQRSDTVELVPGNPKTYRPKTNRSNNWGYNAAEQRDLTYTGMGFDINVHDQWAVESPGAIHDRSREHLSPSDVGIRLQRRMMLAAMEAPSTETQVGTSDPAALRGPGSVDAVSRDPHPLPASTVGACWRSAEAKRRAASSWAEELSLQ